MAAKLTDHDWSLLRLVSYWVLLGLNDPSLDLGLGDPPPQTIDELRFYAGDNAFRLRIYATVDLTRGALAAATDALAAAHRIAAAVQVTAPTDDQLKSLQADLEAVSNQLKSDQRFHAALALAGSVNRILASRGLTGGPPVPSLPV